MTDLLSASMDSAQQEFDGEELVNVDDEPENDEPFDLDEELDFDE